MLVEVPRGHWAPVMQGGVLRVWRSRNFLVQERPARDPAIVVLAVNRTQRGPERWLDGISWDELQQIKFECGYGNHDAVEVYPRDADVVNVANMRHLWIMRDGSLPFAWRNR